MERNNSIVFGKIDPAIVNPFKGNRLLYGVVLFVIAVGIVFRLSHLGGKLYWHDEVYTGFFASGHNPVEAIHALFSGDIITAGQVQSFQAYSGVKQIFLSGINLAMHDPQHPPLYYMLSALMMQFCRDTVLATRLVAAIAGIALIPAIYFLSLELFESVPIASISAALVAASPFHLIYAQEAREYSLWAVLIVLSTLALLQAIRLQTPRAWALYTVAMVAGLYTFLFTFLVVLSHGFYVLWLTRFKYTPLIRNYFRSNGIAQLWFAPCLLFVVIGHGTISGATQWIREPIALTLWWSDFASNFQAVFFDVGLPLGDSSKLAPNFFVAYWISLVVAYALWLAMRRGMSSPVVCILLLGLVTLLLLVAADLVTGGQRSIISRYLMPTVLSLQLLVAYGVGQGLASQEVSTQRFCQMAFTTVLLMGLVSGAVFLKAETWHHKKFSRSNQEVARIINAAPNALLISGSGGTSLGNLVALCYLLPPEQAILAARETGELPLRDQPIGDRFDQIFAVHLNEGFKATIKEQGYDIALIHPEAELWQITKGK